MKKSQSKGSVFKGGITAFMALIFILMLSVVGVLIESASIQITKNRKRADTILALESTFAEYHPELLEQYEVFARFGCTEDVLNRRMAYYGAKNIEHTIQQMQFLTDYNGLPFYHEAIRYMKDWLGIEELHMDSEFDFSPDYEMENKEKENTLELNRMLTESGEELPTENNPLNAVGNLKKKPLLSLLVSNQEQLSNRSIVLETLPSERALQKGTFAEDKESNTVDKLFFVAYILEHFSNITKLDEKAGLLYEQEYLLGGRPGDQENLEMVCKKIMNIRTVANYTYLLTDSAKQAEALTLATTLCSLLAIPGLTEAVKQALLFAWAYGESILDARALLKGKKVPMVKTGETWQLQLANLKTLGTEQEVVNETEDARGLSYQDYLKGLLLLEDKETLSMRCLDLIESNLHIKTDQCMTKVEIKSEVSLRRGIQDIFTTTFGYQ